MRSTVNTVLAGFVLACGVLAFPAQGQEPAYLHCALPLTISPSRLVTADFNGDTFPDFAAVEPGMTSLRLILTDPDAFAAGACGGVTISSINTDRSLVDLAVVDLDGDRDPDIIVAEDRGARVLVNDGAGNFTVRNNINLAIDPLTIVAGDFDSQLPADAALGTADGDIVLLLGVKSSGLVNTTTRIQPSLSIAVDHLTTGDLNNDGRTDLLVLSEESSAYQVLLGEEAGFRQLESVTLSEAPTSVAIEKFDGDDVRDLAVTFANDQLTVFFGSLSPDPTDSSRMNVTFSPGAAVSTGSAPVAVAAGLLDDDLAVDAAVANQMDNTVGIFLNNGNGSLVASNDLCTDNSCSVGNGPSSVVLALLDGDIFLDIVVGTSSGLSFLFSSDPPPTPIPTPTDTPTRTPTSTPTPTGEPTQTPTETPTATPTPSVTRTVTETRTATTVPTKTCPPGGGICVQGDSCSVTAGTDGSSSSPLAPLLIGGLLAVMRWRSKRWGATSRRA